MRFQCSCYAISLTYPHLVQVIEGEGQLPLGPQAELLRRPEVSNLYARLLCQFNKTAVLQFLQSSEQCDIKTCIRCAPVTPIACHSRADFQGNK